MEYTQKSPESMIKETIESETPDARSNGVEIHGTTLRIREGELDLDVPSESETDVIAAAILFDIQRDVMIPTPICVGENTSGREDIALTISALKSHEADWTEQIQLLEKFHGKSVVNANNVEIPEGEIIAIAETIADEGLVGDYNILLDESGFTVDGSAQFREHLKNEYIEKGRSHSMPVLIRYKNSFADEREIYAIHRGEGWTVLTAVTEQTVEDMEQHVIHNERPLKVSVFETTNE